MILGDLSKWEKEQWAYAPILRKAIDYLRMTDLDNADIGTYRLLGEDMVALVQQANTVVSLERKSEHHAKYIDVQMVVAGEEIHVVARQSELNVPVEDQLNDKDYALYETVENEFELLLKPGMFVIYFPDDLHRPACSPAGGTVTKRVVIKINKDLLQA
ncbi:YhcH/YjgK/YiaL family protein [Paenibacillus sp. UNC451MF]|uniref:YhcH/YjgK/YiaL family protein n=1 Tax=Paenibacillus sp. UNC451MF TaxID=1449063 RepID=UPI00048C7F6D|nr:YhcH/YjgK/YiaL family protein [Paenibacillus sp. UNC451MF]